jgi:ligand-binding SRPBCC domain-containing protein
VRSFEISTLLNATPAEVWRRVTTPEGLKDEFIPLMRMTIPRALRGATIDDLPLGTPAGRSWLLLFGVIPVDFDDLTIAELGPGHRFLEISTMLTQSQWRHERLVEPRDGGSRLTDRLGWRGRTRISEAVLGAAVPVLFRNRHRRLRRRFGALSPR